MVESFESYKSTTYIFLREADAVRFYRERRSLGFSAANPWQSPEDRLWYVSVSRS